MVIFDLKISFANTDLIPSHPESLTLDPESPIPVQMEPSFYSSIYKMNDQQMVFLVGAKKFDKQDKFPLTPICEVLEPNF